MRKQNRPRPGVVLRFDWGTSIEKMGDAAQARFLRACLQRGRDPNYCIDLNGLSERDAIRLETLWEQAAPVIDADGEGWAEGVFQRKYAGYVSGCGRTGESPMNYDEYRHWHETRHERDPDLF